MKHRFQIHLGGVIDLLSNHLYSSPSVYVRELLQNATDAIRARHDLADAGAEAGGRIDIRVAVSDTGRPQMVFTDDGVGLTEEETHRFLATIGESSKRTEIGERRGDFIGQFGIGLLSCFVVSDEIAMVTRSARGGPVVEWRGRADGTYSVATREDENHPVGTTVHLSCKAGAEVWFDVPKVRELASSFGALLPYEIHLSSNQGQEHLNAEPPPWRQTHDSPEAAREAHLEFGRRIFEAEFFDCIPLRCEAGDIEGLAFVLPFSPSPTARPPQRVYLKNMLLAEKADNLLPSWAFFVVCVINTNELRPTASRESFYEDDVLEAARGALGDSLRSYLGDLRKNDPRRLEALIALHYRAIKALAVHEAEFLELFLDWLPFETSLGLMTFGAIRKRFDRIRYAPNIDVFRQIAQVAAAQGLGVINAGYSYDVDILERVADVFPELEVERVDAVDLAEDLDDIDGGEGTSMATLLRVASSVLEPYRCRAEVKKFLPAELPVLYVTGDDAAFARTVERAKEETGGHWGDMLGSLVETGTTDDLAHLYFNYENPLVRRLGTLTDERALTLTTRMLYVQALLLGHHPLNSAEMALLNVGLLDLIEWGIDQTPDMLQ